MKLLDAILLALAAGFLLIGIHQSMLHGFQQSYSLFMASSMFFLSYTLVKKMRADKEKQKEEAQQKTKKPSRKK